MGKNVVDRCKFDKQEINFTTYMPCKFVILTVRTLTQTPVSTETFWIVKHLILHKDLCW